MSDTVRVMLAIPTMGYTHAEAYCNRLMNFMHLGKVEAQGEAIHAIRDILLEDGNSVETVGSLLTKLSKKIPTYNVAPDGKRFDFMFAVIGRIFTPVARDQAAKMALENDCDYLFMIDDDMMAPDDCFQRLYAHNVDIVAPLAFTRNYPHKPVLYSCIDGYDPIDKKEFFRNHVVQKYPKDKLVECDAVGFGAVLIKTWILRKMEKPYFMSTCGTGEDILFCYKAKKVGARVFMDTSVKLGHLGSPLNVTEEYVESVRKRDVPDFNKIHPDYDKYEQKNGYKEATFVAGD